MTHELGNQPCYIMKFIKFGLIQRRPFNIQSPTSNVTDHSHTCLNVTNHTASQITNHNSQHHNSKHHNSQITTHHSQPTLQIQQFRQDFVMSEVIVLKPGFLWQGDQVEYVLSRNENPSVGIVIASSIPAVKFISFDVNYHNHFAKFQPATSNKISQGNV
jgi:hypothetical protein